MTRLASASFLFAATLFAPCLFAQASGAPDGLARAQPTTNTAVQPFSISIKMAPHSGAEFPDVFQVGQRIYINIALTNTSTHSIDAPSGWADALDLIYKVVIQDDKGNIVALHVSPTVAFVDTRPDTVDAGKTKSEFMRIDNFYDLTKPGVYQIQVKRYIDVENRGKDEPKYDAAKGEVMSNKITFTVKPATPTTPH